MRTPSLPQTQFEIGACPVEPTDVQMIVHRSWLLAGVAIALAACTVADEANLHQVPPEAHSAVAHATPASNAGNGNVQDMTY